MPLRHISFEKCTSYFIWTNVFINTETIKIGTRVVKRIKKSGDDDDIGTIVNVDESGKEVEVLWDPSDDKQLYCTGKKSQFDLLLFDNAQIGKWKFVVFIRMTRRVRRFLKKCIDRMKSKMFVCFLIFFIYYHTFLHTTAFDIFANLKLIFKTTLKFKINIETY